MKVKGKDIFKAAMMATVMLSMAAPALAAGGGGLESATDAMKTIKDWLFTFVGVAGLVYIVYTVGMAFAERKSWSDVGMALIYCAIAGGAVKGGTWAMELWS
ncbi:MAG: TrbC/VirB2 family protein [Aeromonas sp.]